MKFGKLDMQFPHRGVGRLVGHPAALLRALKMKLPVVFGSHGHVPFAPAAPVGSLECNRCIGWGALPRS